MPINKNKNVLIQITMPKEDYEQLKALHNAYKANGVETSKSKILTHALREYIRILVACDKAIQQKDNKEDKKDA